MRKHFEELLSQLKTILCDMCGVCAYAVRKSADAFRAQDKELAAGVKQSEIASDAKEAEAERLCMKIVITQQPVAHDLFMVTAAMKMVTDLERIADQAADIAAITLRTQGCVLPPSLAEMADTAAEMVEQCAAALKEFDDASARNVCRRDDVLDGLFEAAKAEISAAAERGGCGECSVDMLLAAKYFERIGDHAVNVAEWICFAVGENAL